MSWETSGSAVGMTPIRSLPVRPLSISASPRREILDLGQDPVGVLQDDLPLRRQAHISVAALDDRRAKIVFQQPNRGRKGRLRHVAGVRGAAKVLFARERCEIFELTEDHGALSRRLSWRPPKSGQ